MGKLIDTSAKGVFPISVTPFRDDGAIDYGSMDRLIDYFIALGVPGVTVLGIMGEAVKLSEDESLTFARHVIKRAGGRLQIIVGVSHGGFGPLAAQAQRMMDAGASGVMISPVPGLKTEEAVLGFFDGVVHVLGGDVPIVLQDYPQLSGVFLSIETLGRLFDRHPSIKVLKHEEGSALRKITRLRGEEARTGRSRVAILVGNSGIHLPQELRRGADGANTGVAYPEMLIEVCKRFADGRDDRGETLYDAFLPLIRHEQQPGIGLAIRKEIFRRRGLIASSHARAPGPSLDAADQQELTMLIQRLERRLAEIGESALIAPRT